MFARQCGPAFAPGQSLFQKCRSSRETELAESFPLPVACVWDWQHAGRHHVLVSAKRQSPNDVHPENPPDSRWAMRPSWIDADFPSCLRRESSASRTRPFPRRQEKRLCGSVSNALAPKLRYHVHTQAGQTYSSSKNRPSRSKSRTRRYPFSTA